MRDRDHPVRQLLDWLAGGGELAREDIDELRLADGVNRTSVDATIRDAARKIAEARAVGHQGLARSIARETASELIATVGPPTPERDTLPTHPRDLAALIRRA